jgi:hypothetical protein
LAGIFIPGVYQECGCRLRSTWEAPVDGTLSFIRSSLPKSCRRALPPSPYPGFCMILLVECLQLLRTIFPQPICQLLLAVLFLQQI